MKKHKSLLQQRISTFINKILESNQELTQTDLSKLLGVAKGSVSNYVAGKEMPAIDVLMKLADLGGVTLDEILKGENVEVGTLEPSKLVIISTGQKSIAAGRDVHINQNVKKTYKSTPGPNAITPEQAARLLDLVNQIVEYEAKTMLRPKKHATVWSIFKRKFKVAYYRELNASQFDDAVLYLTKWIGRLKSSLRKSDIPVWRKERIMSIQTRRKQLGWSKDDMVNYLLGKFGFSSLKDLTDSQLDQFYHYIFSQKQ